MSLYKDASLVMLPTAYKDGKLYSVRPADGSGDFTFSRGTTATRVASSGYIEKGRENILLQSNTFNTTWVPFLVTLTSGQSGYDGTNDAWKIERTNTGARVQQSISVSGVNTFSVYAKAGSLNWVQIFNTSSPFEGAFFDIANGVVGTTDSDTIDANITSVGGGWYRIEFSLNYTGTTNFRISPADSDGVKSGSSGYIYIQDAQLEAGLVATDYIETTTTSVSAGILEDMPRLDYSGSCPALLLEPQRSNLVPFSEHLESSDWAKTRCTIEDNSTISPEGVMNASKMTSTDASESYIQDNLATTGTKITWSFFAKKGDLDYAHGLIWDLSANGCRQWFNLSTGAVGGTTTFGSGYSVDSATIEDYGNGWYRCAMVVNSTAGAQGCRVNISSADTTIGSAVNSYGYFYGIQLEDASYSTSYIPTYGASVTRSQDVSSASGLSDAINSSEGVLYAELKWTEISLLIYLSLSDGTNSNRVIIYRTAENNIRMLVQVGGVTQASFIVTEDTNEYVKVAAKYNTNDFAIWVNGTERNTDTSGSTFSANTLNKIGFDAGLTGGFSGSVKQILYFPTALTDTELASLTTL